MANKLKKRKHLTKPIIILVEPQLGENIGMSARAMMNCGLSELRLVNPRDGWPNSNAIAASAEADKVIRNTRVYQNTSEAIADLEVVFAASARVRDMTKPIINPEQAVEEFFLLSESSTRIGVMFGCESKGLKNDDVTLADALINIPLNPHFNSLNLAQAVYTICYEWFKNSNTASSFENTAFKKPPLAKKQALINLFEHLETELERSGFLRISEKKPSMKRNLRNMLIKAQLTDQEVQTFRGIIRSLCSHKNPLD